MTKQWTIDRGEYSVDYPPSANGRGGVVNYSIENPHVQLTDPEVWDYLTDGGQLSDAGYRVSPQSSLGISAVWQAVTLISGDLAKLPVHLYRRLENEDRQRQRQHPAYRVVQKRVNRDVSRFNFWRRMYVFALLWNNADAWIQRGFGGRPVALWPLPPGLTQYHDDTGLITSIVNGQQMAFESSEILHLEGISIDNTRGERFVRAARESFGVALAQQGFAGRFYRRGGRKGGVLMIPPEMPKTASDRVEQGFRKTYESIDAAFKTFVAREGVKFSEAQHSPHEGELSESRREQVREIARRFNLHPSKLGEEARVSYGSKAEDNRDYLDTTLSPWIVQRDEECSLKLLSSEEFNSDEYYFETLTEKMLMVDGAKRAQIYSMARRGEWMSPNEIRQRENMPRRTDPGGDDYSNPNTRSGGGNGEAAVDAHRRLIRGTIERTFRIQRDRAVSAAASKRKLISWLDSHWAMNLMEMIDTLSPYVHAAATVTECDEGHAILYAYGHLLRTTRTVIDETVGQSTAEVPLKEQVAAALDEGFVGRMAAALAEMIVR